MAEQDHLKLSAPARRGAVDVAPKRRMAWSEWGPADGTPVLFSPGAATSGSLGLGGGAVERRGVRLIALDRPGLGGSDRAPGRTLLGRTRPGLPEPVAGQDPTGVAGTRRCGPRDSNLATSVSERISDGRPPCGHVDVGARVIRCV